MEGDANIDGGDHIQNASTDVFTDMQRPCRSKPG